MRAFYIKQYVDDKRIRRLREAANRRQEESVKGFITDQVDKVFERGRLSLQHK